MIPRKDSAFRPTLQDAQVLAGKENIRVGCQQNTGIRDPPGPQLERNFGPGHAETVHGLGAEFRMQNIRLGNGRVDSCLQRLIGEVVAPCTAKYVGDSMAIIYRRGPLF